MKKYLLGMFCLLFILFLTMSANAALTITNEETEIWGGHIVKFFDVAFDSSYAYDGEALTKASRGFSKLDKVIVFGKGNYQFEYDMTNEKVKVFGPAPPIIYEEEHTADAAGQFTLDYPAAFIVSLVRSGGTPYAIIYSGATTVGSEQACLSAAISDNVRTGISAYVPSVAYKVTYVTQAWGDIYELLVQNEAMTGTGVTRHTISGNTIFGVMCVKQDGAVSGVTPIDLADTAATGEMGIDFGENAASGATQAYCLIATSSNQYYITYLKDPPEGSWLQDRWVGNEDATSGTSIMSLDRPLLLWLIGGYGMSNGDASFQIVEEDQQGFYKTGGSADQTHATSGTSEMYTSWGYRGPAATGAAPTAGQVWAVFESGSMSLTHASYLFGHPWEIPNLQLLEIQNGRDLSGLNGVRVIMIGR